MELNKNNLIILSKEDLTMSFKSYSNNNNDNQPTNTTYTPISFSNPESEVSQTRISISYFNRLMKISIANKLSGGSNDQYASYDNDNQASVYISFTKAKILLDLIKNKLLADDDVHNVCIETKQGLFKVSDGVEFGSTMPCISISSADASGNVTETVYQCKNDFYTGAYNYSDGKYSTMKFDDMELSTFMMVLEEYYKSSSYAIASSIMEASMYKREGHYSLTKSIADKVGVVTNNTKSGNYNSKTFLAGDGNMTGSSSGYESATFDDIANSMVS
jgi:hypothetical protein